MITPPNITLRDKGKSPLTTTTTTSKKSKGKKKPGSREKCRGCVKRESIIDIVKMFRRNVMKKANRVEQLDIQIFSYFI